YLRAGSTGEDRALFEQVRADKVRVLGPEDPSTLITLHNLATMDAYAGNLNEAIKQFEQIIAVRAKIYSNPIDRPDALPTLNNLATAYWKTKQLNKSIPLFEQLLPLYQKFLSETHPDTLTAMANLGVNYRDAGRVTEAIPLLKRAHESGR